MSAPAENASAPALADYTHETVAHHEDVPIKRVVFLAVDGSRHSEYAFHWALENFLRESDLLILANVRPFPGYDLSSGSLGAPYMVVGTSYADLYNSMEEQHRLESHALLKTFADKSKIRGIATKAIAVRGDAREEIVRKVVELGADTLIMGSRGLGALKRTLLGSVSDFCAHNVPVPLIIVKEPVGTP